MALYFSYPDNLACRYCVVIPQSCAKFIGTNAYKYLVYHDKFVYERNTGPKCLHVSDDYSINTLPYTYQSEFNESNMNDSCTLLTGEQYSLHTKQLYLETDVTRTILDRINLYDFLRFVSYYDTTWKNIILTVIWPILPSFFHPLLSDSSTCDDSDNSSDNDEDMRRRQNYSTEHEYNLFVDNNGNVKKQMVVYDR